LDASINREHLVSRLKPGLECDRDVPAAYRLSDRERGVDSLGQLFPNGGHDARYKAIVHSADDFEHVRPGELMGTFQ
jgi:hypothetical protein